LEVVLTKPETYTPSYTKSATDFMAARSLDSHGGFFAQNLESGLSVLDCGCGPGSITLGIAERVAPGQVIGIDAGPSQIELATARGTSVPNVSFKVADCYRLPFDNSTFDRVFSHALLEHLAEPDRAVREMWRVLKPGGVVGVCSPDWGGFIISPPSAALTEAVAAYTDLQSRNGGDVGAGRKLGLLLGAAGFTAVSMSARYECYRSLEFIGEYLAVQLERDGSVEHARTLRSWSGSIGGLFAQSWVSAVGQKGPLDANGRGLCVQCTHHDSKRIGSA
jgi:SAM-dependent methyltransferase